MSDPIPVVLLARQAINRGEHGHGLVGDLLIDALRRCARGGREFGARAIAVGAIDDTAARFYRHFESQLFQGRRLW
jgi:hypothetical protein